MHESKSHLVRGVLVLCLVVSSALSHLVFADTLQITWEVKHRFLFFRDARALQKIGIKPGLTASEWVATTLARKPRLLKTLIPYDPYNDKDRRRNSCVIRDESTYKTAYIPCRESYVRGYFDNPTEHEIIIQVRRPPAGKCEFSLNGQRQTVKPCSEPLSLKVPYGRSSQVTVKSTEGLGQGDTSIEVNDWLLFAFGDSFTSGEGNPDVPILHSTWQQRKTPKVLGRPDPRAWWLRGNYDRAGPWDIARWLDQRCHRSLLSWPFLAAMRLAAENPHAAVRIASWACTGAEIPDGFYSAQVKPSEGMGNVTKSQFAFAREAICNNPNGSGASATVLKWKKKDVLEKGCAPKDTKRNIDAILFTLGGNDVFFGPVVRNQLFATGTRSFLTNYLVHVIRPWTVKTQYQAEDRIRGNVRRPDDSLSERYAALKRGFALLPVKNDNVFQIQYPNPVYEKVEPTRIYCDRRDFDGFDAVDVLQKNTNITAGEGRSTEKHLIERLTEKIHENPHRWAIIESHLGTLQRHGVCAYRDKISKEFRFPQYKNGRWLDGYSPDQYKHYEDRARWFRTVNDVVLGVYTGKSYLPVEGAMHPSAQGHAEIADRVYERLQQQLGSAQ